MCRMACEDWKRQSRPVPRSSGDAKAGVRAGGTGRSRTLPWNSEEKKRLMESCERSSGGLEEEGRKKRERRGFRQREQKGRREKKIGGERFLFLLTWGGCFRGLTDPDLP